MKRTSVFLAVSLLCITTAAQADPLQITSGFVFLAPNTAHDATFQLSGSGLSFAAEDVEDQLIVVPPTPTTLRTGTSIDLSAFSFIGQNDGRFPATGSFEGSPVLVTGPMSFNAPRTFLTCGPTQFVPMLCGADAPFAFFAALTVRDAATGAMLFTRPFAGQGRVHGTLWNDGINTSNAFTLQYSFDPAPVPEPGTFLLLGSGLCGACVRAIRRKRTAQFV